MSLLCGWRFFLFCIIRTRPLTKGPSDALHARDLSYAEGRGRTHDGHHSRKLTKEIWRRGSKCLETAAALLIGVVALFMSNLTGSPTCVPMIAHLRPVGASALIGDHHGAESTPHVKSRSRLRTFSYMVEQASFQDKTHPQLPCGPARMSRGTRCWTSVHVVGHTAQGQTGAGPCAGLVRGRVCCAKRACTPPNLDEDSGDVRSAIPKTLVWRSRQRIRYDARDGQPILVSAPPLPLPTVFIQLWTNGGG